MRVETKKTAGTVPLKDIRPGGVFEFQFAGLSSVEPYMAGVFIRTEDQVHPPVDSIVRASRLNDGYHAGFSGTVPVIPRPDLYVTSDGEVGAA